MASVNVQQWKRHAAWIKGFVRQVHHNNGVFTTREKQHRAFELGSHFPHEKNGLGLELLQMRTDI
jgi:hypothetical protein